MRGGGEEGVGAPRSCAPQLVLLPCPSGGLALSSESSRKSGGGDQPPSSITKASARSLLAQHKVRRLRVTAMAPPARGDRRDRDERRVAAAVSPQVQIPDDLSQLQPIPTSRTKSGWVGVYPARKGRWQAQVNHRSIGG